MDLAQLFDPYSRKARLTPALFSLLPPVLTVALLVPSIYQRLVGLLSLLVASGALVILANIARHLGHKTQTRLFEAWGGAPSTLMLRHGDRTIDAVTKQRYHEFLEANVPTLRLPSPSEEANDSDAADAKYSSACKWLLERTRDTHKFNLLFKENVEYGFRRNLRGLRPVGICLSLACTAVSALILYQSIDSRSNETAAIAGTLSLISLGLWLFVVTDNWVRDSADSYAIRLLAACDLIGA